MSNDAIESKTYRSKDGSREFRVDIIRDEMSDSPRDDMESPVHMVTMSRWFKSPDKGDPTQYAPFEHFEDSRRLSRYINLFRPDIRDYGFLYRNEHDGTLSVSFDVSDGDRPDGIAVIDHVELLKHGMEDMTREQLNEIISGDVKTYNMWVTGEVVGYVVTELHADVCPTCHREQDDVELGSCFGFYPDGDGNGLDPYGYVYSQAQDEIDCEITEV